ncbi:MAG: class I SAM-dependent methyltransferase [Candidatus Altiarchaeota archaeon]
MSVRRQPWEVYNQRARFYDSIMSASGYHPTVREMIRTIPLDVGGESRVLDIGCGTGLATDVFLERYPDSEIVGMDCSESMLRIYNNKFPGLSTLCGDFNNGNCFRSYPGGGMVKLEPSSFDIIVSTGAVSEYGDLERTIPFIHSLLREDGVFINVGVRKNVINKISGRIWHYKPNGREKLVQSCRDTGFRDIEDMNISIRHFPSNMLKYVVKAVK